MPHLTPRKQAYADKENAADTPTLFLQLNSSTTSDDATLLPPDTPRKVEGHTNMVVCIGVPVLMFHVLVVVLVLIYWKMRKRRKLVTTPLDQERVSPRGTINDDDYARLTEAGTPPISPQRQEEDSWQKGSEKRLREEVARIEEYLKRSKSRSRECQQDISFSQIFLEKNPYYSKPDPT